jgi:hypothetical protein
MGKGYRLLRGVLAVAAWGWCVSFSHAQTSEMKSLAQTPAAPQVPAPLPASAGNLTEQNQTEEIRDPFLSGMPKPPAPEPTPGQQGLKTEVSSQPAPEETFDYSSLKVTGIVWGTLDAKAIINGEVMGVGSVVNGAEIIKISEEGILFKYKDKEYLMNRHAVNAKPQH